MFRLVALGLLVLSTVTLAPPVHGGEARAQTPVQPPPDSAPPPGSEEDAGGDADPGAETTEEELAPEVPEPPPLPKTLAPFVPEADRKEVTVRLVSDLACTVTVDGVWKAKLEPETPLEVAVKTGSRNFRATSTEAPGAFWSQVVTVLEVETEREAAPHGDGSEIPEVSKLAERQEIEIRLRRLVRKLRREERQTGLYRDSKRGLMWQRRDNGANVSWEKARRHCEETRFAGFEDWRLPSLDEIQSLGAIWSRAPFKIVGVVTLTSCCLWTSDPVDDRRFWTLDFRYRKPFSSHPDLSYGLRALCVRAAAEEDPDPAG